jgi:hypothetical protein
VCGEARYLKICEEEAYKKLGAAKVQVVQQSRAMDGGQGVSWFICCI